MSNIGLKVKSIKKIGKRKTFDLFVPIYNNFFLSNGVLSHNSGKTWKLLTLAQLYHSAFDYKIFDIGAGKRNENGFWCFPSDEKVLWAQYQDIVGNMAGEGAKEYNVKLLYPMMRNKLPSKVPQHLPRIKTQIFTIYFKEITAQDISLVIGDLTRNATYMWNRIVKELPDNANGIDILYFIDKHLKSYKNLVIYKAFIKPAIDNMLLAGKDAPTNINLIEEAKDKKTITILNNIYVSDNIWKMFFMGFILRRLLFDLAMKDIIPKKNIAIFREAGDYMKKVDKDLKDMEQVQIFRNLLTNIARYARSGLIPFLDTQSPSDTRNLIEGQDDLLCISEISSLDIKDIMDKLKAERRVSRKIIDNLYNIAQYEMVIVERKQKAKWIKRVQPPRCMAYKGKSFEVVWANKINDYKSTKEDINMIKKYYDESKEKVYKLKANEKLVEEPEKITPKERLAIKKELVEEEELVI